MEASPASSPSSSPSQSPSPSSPVNGDSQRLKDVIFTDLMLECRLSAPGARLSPRLRTALEKLPFIVRKEITNCEMDRCTPLFMAAKRGNVEIVEYLIVVCGADLEKRSLFEVTDDRSHHYVTPLWCAAVSGKLDVIRCLVKNGANINAESDTGSTPVRSACFMTHVEVVRYLVENGADINKANFNNGTCLINSVQSVVLCNFLLENGANVNATDIQHKTALHYAIQEHRKETTKLLLNHGADPFAFSRSGDDALQTACLKGAVQIFTLLINRIEYSDERLANAHELLGSTMMDDFNDSISAVNNWRTATYIRNRGGTYLAKRPVNPPRAAYRYATEFTTEADLELIATDIDMIRIQSLIICERILGLRHKDTVFRLMYRGAAYADALRYQRCIDLWIWTLQIRLERGESILSSDTCFATQALVKIMIDLKVVGFNAVLMNESVRHNVVPRFSDIAQVFTLLINNMKEVRPYLDIRPFYKKQSEMFDKTLKCVTHLIYLLIETALTKDEKNTLVDLVTTLVKMNIRSAYKGDTILHLSVSSLNVLRSTYHQEEIDAIFPHYDVVKLLLDCGMNVNAKNGSKSTPLHVACVPYNYSSKLVQLLLENGAHIDQPNRFGDTPAQLLKNNYRREIHLLNYVSLKCLAAREVIHNNIPYDNGRIPATLVDFVKFHEC